MTALPWADLALGATALLAIGTAASLAIRAPHDRHRAGATTIMALLCWLGLALPPLPRYLSGQDSNDTAATAPIAPLTAPARADRPADLPEHVAPSAARVAARTPIAAPAPRPALPPLAERGARAAPLALADLLAALWIAGSLASLLLLLVGHTGLFRILRHATRPEPWLDALLRGASGEHPPRLLVSDRATRPFCCGMRRPTIVVPRTLCAPHLRAGLVQVLRHELAHLRRGDVRVQALFALAAVPFWWHPLLFWLRARTRFAAELVADAVAAAPDHRSYARDLLEVASAAPRARWPHVPALSLFERESDFSRRMRMLLTNRGSITTHSSTTARTARATILLLAIAGAAGTFGRPALTAQEPATGNQQDDAALDAKLRRPVPVSHRFESATLADVAAFCGQAFGVNVVPTPAARQLDPASTTLDGFRVEAGSAAAALDAITNQLGLRWSIENGVVVIDVARTGERSDDEEVARIIAMLREHWRARGPEGRRHDSDQPLLARLMSDHRSHAEIARLIASLSELGGRAATDSPAHPMDLDRLVAGLGEHGAVLRDLIGSHAPGVAEKATADLLTRLIEQNRDRSTVMPPMVQPPSPTHDLAAIADLATRAIDARGEMQSAKAALEHIVPLAEDAAVEGSEVERARIRLQTAAAKLEALRTLVESEFEALILELDAARKLLAVPHDRSIESRVRRLEGYVRVLESTR